MMFFTFAQIPRVFCKARKQTNALLFIFVLT